VGADHRGDRARGEVRRLRVQVPRPVRLGGGVRADLGLVVRDRLRALILVHELGHYVEAKRQRLDVSIPRFIPFIGAYVAIKNSPLNPTRNALLALAGPVAGGLASAFCWGLGSLEQSSLLHALAYAGFFLNLVNLIPIGILDGGAVWSAYKLARAEPMVPLSDGGAATMLPGAGRDRAALILTMYLGLALLLALGMWGTHVPQSRL
jgi:Zn-dependent protease